MAMTALRTTALAAVLLLPAALAHAQPAWPDCPANYPGGVPPRSAGADTGDVTDLCYHGFAVGFSRDKAGPLSSSQYLTRQRMAAAAVPTGAPTAMHGEARVPQALRIQPSDYAAAGVAAGRLTPEADMEDPAGKSDSASTANTVPLTPQAHRIWAKLEQATREIARQDDVIYVVSGPVYGDGPSQAAAGRLRLPAGVFKAIYNPEAGWAGAFVCENTVSPNCQVVTLAALQAMTGIDVFPALPDSVKQSVPALPVPG